MTDASQSGTPPNIRLAAMNLLARREHSFHELLEKLAARYPDLDPAAALRPALERLRDEGLQSDERFALAYVRYRSSRGMGPLRIRAELQPRRLEAGVLEQALAQEELDWDLLCEQAFLRKFSPRPGADLKEQQRWQRFLLQRGFGHDQVRRVLRAAAGKGELQAGSGAADSPDDDRDYGGFDD
jgi:regulatory protein